MQKNFKRILSLILTAAMIFTMNTTAFAEPGSATEEPAAALDAAVGEGAAVEAAETEAVATEEPLTEAETAEAPAAETTTEAPAAETAAAETAVAETEATETPVAEAVTEEVAEETAVVEDEVEAVEGTASQEEDKELAASAAMPSDYVLLDVDTGKDAASDNFAVSENKDGGYFLLIKETGDYYLAPQKDDAVKLILSVNAPGVSVSLDAAKLTAGKPLGIEVGDVVASGFDLTSVDRELTAIYVRSWDKDEEEYAGTMVRSSREKDSGDVSFEYEENTVYAGASDHPTMIYIGNLKDTKFPASKMHAEADEIDQKLYKEFYDPDSLDRLKNNSVFLMDDNYIAGTVVSGNAESGILWQKEDENKKYRVQMVYGDNSDGYPSGNDLRFSTLAVTLTDENMAPVSFSLLKLNAPKFEGTEKVVRKAGFVDGYNEDDESKAGYTAYFDVDGKRDGYDYKFAFLDKTEVASLSKNEYTDEDTDGKQETDRGVVADKELSEEDQEYIKGAFLDLDLWKASLAPGVNYTPVLKITTPVTVINGDGDVTVQGETEWKLVEQSFTTPFDNSDFVDFNLFGTQYRDIDRTSLTVWVPINKVFSGSSVSVCLVSGDNIDKESYITSSENKAWEKLKWDDDDTFYVLDKDQRKFRYINEEGGFDVRTDVNIENGDQEIYNKYEFHDVGFDGLTPGTKYGVWVSAEDENGKEAVKVGEVSTVKVYEAHFALNKTELEYRSMIQFQYYSDDVNYYPDNFEGDVFYGDEEDMTYLAPVLPDGTKVEPGDVEYLYYKACNAEPVSYSFLSGNTVIAKDIKYGDFYDPEKDDRYTLYDLLKAGEMSDAQVYEKNRKYTVSANWDFKKDNGEAYSAQAEFTLVPSTVPVIPYSVSLKTKDHKISQNTVKFSIDGYKTLAGYDGHYYDDGEDWYCYGNGRYNTNEDEYVNLVVSAGSAALAAFSVDGATLTKDTVLSVGEHKLTIEDVSKLEDLEKVKEFHEKYPGMELTNLDWVEECWDTDLDYDEVETEKVEATLTVYPSKVSDFKLNPGKVMYGETGRENGGSGAEIYNKLFNPSITADGVSGNALEEFGGYYVDYKFFSKADMAAAAISENGKNWYEDTTASDTELKSVSADGTVYIAAKFSFFGEEDGNNDLTTYTTSSVKISPREVVVMLDPNEYVGFKRKEKPESGIVTVSENEDAYGSFYLRWVDFTEDPYDYLGDTYGTNRYFWNGSFADGDLYEDHPAFDKTGKQLLSGTVTISAGHIQDTEPGYFKAPITTANVLSAVTESLGKNYTLVTPGKGFVRVIPAYYLTFTANNNGEALERKIEIDPKVLTTPMTVNEYLNAVKIDNDMALELGFTQNFVDKNLYYALFNNEGGGEINDDNGEFIRFINSDYDYVKYWKEISSWKYTVDGTDYENWANAELTYSESKDDDLNISWTKPHDYYFMANLYTKVAENVNVSIIPDVYYDGRAHVMMDSVLTKKNYKKEVNDLYITVNDGEKELRFGKDYTVTYKNNVNASVTLDDDGKLQQNNTGAKRPSVVVKGKGAFKGFSVTLYFNILPRNLMDKRYLLASREDQEYIDDLGFTTEAEITGLKHTYDVKGAKKIKPVVTKSYYYWYEDDEIEEDWKGENKTSWAEKTFKLKENKDYTPVLYKYDAANNWWARQDYLPKKIAETGDYLYTVWGKGNYCGSIPNEFDAGAFGKNKDNLMWPKYDSDGTPVYDWDDEDDDVVGNYVAYQFTVVADDSIDLENGKASATKKSLPYVKDKYYGAEDFGIAMNAGSGKAKKTLTDGKEYAVRFLDEEDDDYGVVSINAAGTYIPRIYSIEKGGYYGYIDGPKVTIKGQKLSAKDFKVTYRNNDTGNYEEYKKPLPFDSRDNRIKLEITPAGQKKGLSSDSFDFWVEYEDEEDELQKDGVYENSQPNTYEVYVNGVAEKGFEENEDGVKIKAFKRDQMSLADAITAGSLSINLLDAPYNIKGAYPTISMNYYGRQQKSFQPLVNNFKRTFTDNYGNTTELTFTVKNNSKVGEGKATMTIKAEGALKGSANKDSAGKFTYNIVPYDATYQDIWSYNADDYVVDQKYAGNITDGGGSDHEWIFMEKMPWLDPDYGFKYGQVLAVVKDGLKAKAKKGQDAVTDYSKKADVTLYQTAYQYFKDVNGKGDGGYRLVAYKLNNNQYKKAISCNVIPDAGGLNNHTNVYLNNPAGDKGEQGFLFKNTKTEKAYNLYDKKADIKSITVVTKQIGMAVDFPVLYTLPRYSALFAEFKGERFRPYVLSVTLKDGTVLGPNSFDVIYGQNSSVFGNITIVLKRNEKTRDYTNGGSKTFRFVILSREAQKI